jgi:thiol-disulfide isomerase/thioredoxin
MARHLTTALLLVGILVTAVWAGDADTNGATSAPPAQHLLANGQAYDYMGAGVEDAEVTLTITATGQTLGPFKTNAYGDFAIHTDQPLTGKAVVTIRKIHHEEIRREITLAGPDGPPFIDAGMRGSVVLAGTVMSKQGGRPLAGAVVRIETAYEQWSADADSNGAFRLEQLPPGPCIVVAEADGFARWRKRIAAVESAGPQAIELARERIVHLRVTDETLRPLGGVSVECVDEPVHDYRQEITNAEGRVALRGLRFDATQLAVRLGHQRYVSDVEFERVLALPADTHVSTHGLVMQPAGVVVGKVTNASTGKPHFGARVSAGRVLSDRLPRAWTDFEGAFQLAGVTPGMTVVTVHLAGHGPEVQAVRVEAGQQAQVDFQMSAGRAITGRVVDPEGAPVADVHVRATRWRDHDTLGLQAMTDEQGRFAMVDAPADAFEVALYARGYKPLLDQVIRPGQSDYVFELAVDPREGPGVGGSGPQVNTPAPDFAVTTLDGQSVKLAELRGKIVLLDFWATWCGPCLGEIPNLTAAHQAFGGRDDFVMLSISIDRDPAKVRALVEARKMKWLHVAGPQSGADRAAEAYAVSAIPALYVIDREGKIAARDLYGDQIAATVKAQLDAAVPSPKP